MSLNFGSSMTARCKGIKRSAPQRVRMPWTEPREHFAHCILSRKDNAILDGKAAFAGIARSAQLEPIEALKAVVAKREYNVSTGMTLFQLANHLKFNGRGQRFFRKEWREGTYDKHVTLAAVHFNRDGATGEAYGYTTFHGETSHFPIAVDNAGLPGWFVEFADTRAVPFERVVPPPPSEGSDVPVDPKKFRLKAYPYYDAPNPPEYVERLLRERGVLPDVEPVAEDAAAEGGAAGGDTSQHKDPSA